MFKAQFTGRYRLPKPVWPNSEYYFKWAECPMLNGPNKKFYGSRPSRRSAN